MAITQEPTQSLTALHLPGAADAWIAGEQQDVALPLMIALSMVMLDVFAQGAPQGALAEEDYLGALLLYGCADHLPTADSTAVRTLNIAQTADSKRPTTAPTTPSRTSSICSPPRDAATSLLESSCLTSLGLESSAVEVGSGSFASFRPPASHCRSTPMNRHARSRSGCLKRCQWATPQAWPDMDEATDINTSTSTSSRPDLRHVLAGFHKLRRTRPPIPRSPRSRNGHRPCRIFFH
jgi:hypothetical protein